MKKKPRSKRLFSLYKGNLWSNTPKRKKVDTRVGYTAIKKKLSVKCKNYKDCKQHTSQFNPTGLCAWCWSRKNFRPSQSPRFQTPVPKKTPEEIAKEYLSEKWINRKKHDPTTQNNQTPQMRHRPIHR